LFHPAATSRVPPFRDFPSQHSRTGSSPARALSSVGRSRLHAVAHMRQLPQPRPQGFDPCRESVACTPVLPDAPPVSLLGFLLLQVFPLHTVENAVVHVRALFRSWPWRRFRESSPLTYSVLPV
jgi:hypothetical protein